MAILKEAEAGMTEHEVSWDKLVSARRSLITGVRIGQTGAHEKFLISLYRRQTEWKLLPQHGVDQLPAVKWPEMNLDRAGAGTRKAIVKRLEAVLSK